MSKYVQYLETKSKLESLEAALAQIESDESFKKIVDFKSKLDALMTEFKMTPADVTQLFGISSGAPVKASSNAGSTRKAKTYVNPHTKEKITTKGGNHKVLKEWKKEYGSDEVESWAA